MRTGKKNRTWTAALCAALAMHAAAVGAQWVEFTDETGTRLTLEPFADAPLNDPFTDTEEKDVAVGDLDRDGDDDVVVVRKRPFSNPGPRQDVLLMNEGGVLVDRTADLAAGFLSAFTDARDVFIGDMDGDEWPDVLIANTFGQQPRLYMNAGEDSPGNWLGLIEEPGRLPVLQVPTDLSTLQFCAVWAGDVTGNGLPDLYFSNYVPSDGTTDVLMINDGSGNFSNESASRLGSYANVAFGTSVEIRDVDNDGDNDIVKMSTLYPSPPFAVGQYILFNDGTGTFNTVPYQSLPADQPYMFTIGDLNNDGLLDQFLVGDNQDRVILAQSVIPDTNIDFSVAVLSLPRTNAFGGNVKMADVDGDGFLDVGVAPIDVDIQNCGFSEDFALLRNDGAGALDDPWAGAGDQNFHVDPHDFGFLDLNGDTCVDILMGLCTGWRVFLQTCTAQVVAPLGNYLVQTGTLIGGGLPSLAASDDSYARIDAVLDASETRYVTTSIALATSPAPTVSGLEVTLETAADEAGTFLLAQLRNFSSGAWETVQIAPQGTRDTVSTVSGLAAPNDYVRGDGLMAVRLVTLGSAVALPAGYQFRIDQVEFAVTP